MKFFRDIIDGKPCLEIGRLRIFTRGARFWFRHWGAFHRYGVRGLIIGPLGFNLFDKRVSRG